MWEKLVQRAVAAGKTPPDRPPESVPPPEPHIPRLVVNDVTTEVLGVIIAGQPRGCLLVRDELAGFFGDMNRYNNGSGDRAFWLEARGGGDFSVERLSRDPVRINRLTIGVVGTIQPDRLADLLMKEKDDDGMLARFCPVFPASVPVAITERRPDEAMAERAFARLFGVEMIEEPSGEWRPGYVAFDEAARHAMRDYYASVREAEAQYAGLLKSFLGKLPGIVARLSLVLAMLDWAAGDQPVPPKRSGSRPSIAPVISRTTICCRWRGARMRKRRPSVEERAARTLAQVLRKEAVEHITKPWVLNLALEGLRSSRQVEAALKLLVEANILLEFKVPTGGRPKFEWLVNPRFRS